MKKEITGILIAAVMLSASSCKSTKETATDANVSDAVKEMLSRMDANKDGKLSKEEVRGQLLTNFATIDTNSDGFISAAELEKAPKPEGQRPGQGGQRGGPPRN